MPLQNAHNEELVFTLKHDHVVFHNLNFDLEIMNNWICDIQSLVEHPTAAKNLAEPKPSSKHIDMEKTYINKASIIKPFVQLDQNQTTSNQLKTRQQVNKGNDDMLADN